MLLGRRYIGYELNANYNKLQEARLDDAVKIHNEFSQAKQSFKINQVE